MLCLKTQLASSFCSSFRVPLSSSKHLGRQLRSWPSKSSIKMMSSQAKAVEHIVLFKVKDDIDPSKVSAMVNGLGSLVSLHQVLHLTVGQLLRNRSSSLTFTHMLHSRYKSKEDLEAYSAHPSHIGVVKGNVLPIVDDIMAVDWVAEDLSGDLIPPQGSAIRVTFLKLKENAVGNEVLEVMKGIHEKFEQITQYTYGENFSPARAKGFSIASLAVFPGQSELAALDANHELVNYEKDKVRDHLESVVAVDYVVPPQQPPQSASL